MGLCLCVTIVAVQINSASIRLFFQKLFKEIAAAYLQVAREHAARFLGVKDECCSLLESVITI